MQDFDPKVVEVEGFPKGASVAYPRSVGHTDTDLKRKGLMCRNMKSSENFSKKINSLRKKIQKLILIERELKIMKRGLA